MVQLAPGTHFASSICMDMKISLKLGKAKIVNLNKQNRDWRFDSEKKKLRKQEVIGMVIHNTA